MRATCVAIEESDRNQSQSTALALQMVWYHFCFWEARIMAARNHLHCTVSECFSKACNNACNESPESHLWGLENVSLSKCELLSHSVHVRQTVFSSQRAPLSHYYHQTTDVALQESFSYKLLYGLFQFDPVTTTETQDELGNVRGLCISKYWGPEQHDYSKHYTKNNIYCP